MSERAPRPESAQAGAYSVRDHKGKRIVSFECQRCRSPLESPLVEAGQTFPCPTCGQQVTTPGVRELREQQEREAAAQARESERARQAADVPQREQAARDAELKAAAERAARDRQRHDQQRAAERQASRAEVGRPDGRVTPLMLFASIALAAIIMYIAAVLPLQIKLRETQQRLVDLAATVNNNAHIANANVDALEKVVNNNADVANRRANAVSDDLQSLTRTVNYNADVANSNNRRW